MKAKIRCCVETMTYVLAMVVISFILLLLYLGHCLWRPVNLFLSQRQALKGLSAEQCALLRQLWETSKQQVHWVNQAAKHRSHAIRLKRKQATTDLDTLKLACLKAGISSKQIYAFLITTYNFEG